MGSQSSLPIGKTPVDVVDEYSLTAGTAYLIGCTGDYPIYWHEDDEGTLTAATVKAAAGAHPPAMRSGSKVRQPDFVRHTPATSGKFWIWSDFDSFASIVEA